MITGAACTDVYLIAKLSAFGSCCQLAVFYGVARCFKETKCCLCCCFIFLFCAHAVGVDRIAVYICRVSDLISVVCYLRCCPGGIGDRVVDYQKRNSP